MKHFSICCASGHVQFQLIQKHTIFYFIWFPECLALQVLVLNQSISWNRLEVTEMDMHRKLRYQRLLHRSHFIGTGIHEIQSQIKPRKSDQIYLGMNFMFWSLLHSLFRFVGCKASTLLTLSVYQAFFEGVTVSKLAPWFSCLLIVISRRCL